MKQTATDTKQGEWFIPEIVVIPTFSRHDETLLKHMISEKILTDQSNFNRISNYIAINQNGEGVPIAAVRTLIEQLSYASYQGREQIVSIFHLDTASIPAQNALLKLLEEPPVRTRIFLTVESTGSLVEPLVSRCRITHPTIDIQKDYLDTNIDSSIYSQLPTLSYRELIAYVDGYSERPAATTWVLQYQQHVLSELQQQPTDAILRKLLLATEHARTQLQQNANVRLVLEALLFRCKELAKELPPTH